MVEMTSSASVPPSATYPRDNLLNEEDKGVINVQGDKNTYCIYLEMNLFITPPVTTIQGSMDVIARARRHDRE